MCLAASVGRPMNRYDESGQKFSLRSGNFIASMKWIRGSSTSLQTLSITSGELMRVQANNFVVNGHRHTRTEEEAIALNGPLDENSFVCSFRTNTDIRWHFSTFARRHPAPATECQKENKNVFCCAANSQNYFQSSSSQFPSVTRRIERGSVSLYPEGSFYLFIFINFFANTTFRPCRRQKML